MVKLVIWNFIQTRSILLGGVLEPSPTPCETQTSARQRTEIFSYQNWSFETFSCPLHTSGWRPGAISIPFWELVFLMPQLLCNWSKNGGKAFWKKFKTGKYLKDSFKTQGFDKKPSVFWRLQASVTLHKIAQKIAWEYPLSKRGLWDFEQHSDFICHWQKTRNWQKTLENKLDIYKNLEINIKIYRNYKIKLEIYKNLQIKFEMYSYFKLENKLKIFEFFVNGRWSQYKSGKFAREP